MILPPPEPRGTIAEVEIGLPEFAARYTDSTGEQLSIDPRISRRAVAIFARDEPWSRILEMTGEAAGFRVSGNPGHLRLTPTRKFGVGDAESALNIEVASLLRPPQDLVAATTRHRRAKAASEQYERGSLSFGGFAEARRLRALAEEDPSIDRPENFAVGRFLQRAGTLPLGKTRMLSGASLLSLQEYRLIAEAPTTTELEFRSFRLAVLLTPTSLTIASTLGPPTQLPVAIEPPVRMTRLALRPNRYGLTWRVLAYYPPAYYPRDGSRRFTSHFGGDRRVVGDFLKRIHESSGRPCAAPALRVDAGSLNGYRLFQVRDESGSGYSERGPLVATSDVGDGLWPADVDRLGGPRPRTLLDYAALSVRLDQVQHAATLDGLDLVGRSDFDPLVQGGPFLAFLHRMSRDDQRTLLRTGRLTDAQISPGTRRALMRCQDEESAPASALSLSRPALSLSIELARLQSTLPATSPTASVYRCVYGNAEIPYMRRIRVAEESEDVEIRDDRERTDRVR